MRHPFRLLPLSILLFALMASSPSIALEAGDSAPHFQLDGTASQVNLADYKDKLVYLDFWASWCGPCRQSFPWMNALERKYKERGFKVLAINLDAQKADAEKFLAQLPAQFQVAFDPKGETPRLYGVKGMPTSYLIRDGKILHQHAGFNSVTPEKLEQLIIQALKDGK